MTEPIVTDLHVCAGELHVRDVYGNTVVVRADPVVIMSAELVDTLKPDRGVIRITDDLSYRLVERLVDGSFLAEREQGWSPMIVDAEPGSKAIKRPALPEETK